MDELSPASSTRILSSFSNRITSSQTMHHKKLAYSFDYRQNESDYYVNDSRDTKPTHISSKSTFNPSSI